MRFHFTVHVKSLNDGTLSTNFNAKSLKILKKTQDPAGIRTQDLLITSQTLLKLSHCTRLLYTKFEFT